MNLDFLSAYEPLFEAITARHPAAKGRVFEDGMSLDYLSAYKTDVGLETEEVLPILHAELVYATESGDYFRAKFAYLDLAKSFGSWLQEAWRDSKAGTAWPGLKAYERLRQKRYKQGEKCKSSKQKYMADYWQRPEVKERAKLRMRLRRSSAQNGPSAAASPGNTRT